jgi:hypothetical protein
MKRKPAKENTESAPAVDSERSAHTTTVSEGVRGRSLALDKIDELEAAVNGLEGSLARLTAQLASIPYLGFALEQLADILAASKSDAGEGQPGGLPKSN